MKSLCSISLLNVFIQCVVLHRSLATQQFSVTPENATAIDGDTTAMFECTVSDKTGVLFWKKGSSTIYDEEDGDVEDPNKHSVSGDHSNGQYDLTIYDIVEDDDDSYTCEVTGVNHASEAIDATAYLTVYFAAYINPRPSDAVVVEGENGELNCAAHGNPDEITFTWFKENVILSPDDSNYIMNEGILIIPDTDRYDSGFYKCQVNNIIGGDNAEAYLDVQYAPTANSVDNVYPKENTDIEITCNVTDGNPLPTNEDATWKGPDDLDADRDNPLTLHNIQRNEAGVYTCVVSNVYYTGDTGQGSSQTTITVEYSPDVYVPRTYYVVLGDTVYIECIVDAIPQEIEVKWSSVDDEISNSYILSIPDIEKEEDGPYLCEAWNILTTEPSDTEYGSNTTYIHVHYGPEITVTEYIEILEGADLLVECVVDANPEATVVWKKDSETTDSSQLSIESINRDQAGDYICLATNTLFNGEVYTDTTSTTINVMYGAEFAEDGSPSEITTVILPVTTTANVTCIGDGNPEVVYTWFHNGDIIYADNSQRYTLISPGGTLQIDDINRYEFGDEYTCNIVNDIGGDSASSKLYLHYNPIIVNYEDNKRAVDEGQNVTLDCIVDAVPHADVYWFNGTTESSECGRCQINTVEVNETHVHSKLNIFNVGAEDYGEYNCTAINMYGVDSLVINLDVTTPPDPVTEVTIIDRSFSTITVTWKPGFDGGYTQVFYIEYYTFKEELQYTEYTINTTDTITGLEAATEYTITVISKNKLGESRSDPVIDNTLPTPPIPGKDIVFDDITGELTIENPYGLCVQVAASEDGDEWIAIEVEDPCNSVVTVTLQGEGYVNIRYCAADTDYLVCSDPLKMSYSVQEEISSSGSVGIIVFVTILLAVLIAAGIIVFIWWRKKQESNNKGIDGVPQHRDYRENDYTTPRLEDPGSLLTYEDIGEERASASGVQQRVSMNYLPNGRQSDDNDIRTIESTSTAPIYTEVKKTNKPAVPLDPGVQYAVVNKNKKEKQITSDGDQQSPIQVEYSQVNKTKAKNNGNQLPTDNVPAVYAQVNKNVSRQTNATDHEPTRSIAEPPFLQGGGFAYATPELPSRDVDLNVYEVEDRGIGGRELHDNNVYDLPELQTDKQTKPQEKNVEGLIYADLDLTRRTKPQPAGGKPKPTRNKPTMQTDAVEYAAIDVRKLKT